MTIEIKQLIIRAVVEDPREPPAGTGRHRSRAASEPARRTAPGDAHRDVAVDHETVIAECTRQVLRELRKGRGR